MGRLITRPIEVPRAIDWDVLRLLGEYQRVFDADVEASMAARYRPERGDVRAAPARASLKPPPPTRGRRLVFRDLVLRDQSRRLDRLEDLTAWQSEVLIAVTTHVGVQIQALPPPQQYPDDAGAGDGGGGGGGGGDDAVLYGRIEAIQAYTWGLVQKRAIECDFRPEKEEKDLIYVGKFVDCNWGPFEALDFVNLVSSLLFQSAGFSFSFAISFDAFEAKKDLFWIRVFWLFSNTLVVQKFLAKPILFIGSG
ncbi:hypothetical protein R6Q57_015215 [Mikania cordata]